MSQWKIIKAISSIFLRLIVRPTVIRGPLKFFLFFRGKGRISIYDNPQNIVNYNKGKKPCKIKIQLNYANKF